MKQIDFSETTLPPQRLVWLRKNYALLPQEVLWYNVMNTEFEIKILDIDVGSVVETLVKEGFHDKGSVNFRRYTYDLPQKEAWIRLRTDGTKTTLTYKMFVSNSVDGVKELEVTVDDFEKTHELLGILGYEPKNYQENKRHLFVKDDVEVSVDEWPHIPAYLEIEGRNELSVTDTLKQLQLTEHKTTSETTSKVYEMYGLDIDSYDRLTF